MPLAQRYRRGFTLIELLSVVVIAGILAAVVVPRFLEQRSGAEDAHTANLVSQTYKEATSQWAQATYPNFGATSALVADLAGANPEVPVDALTSATGVAAKVAAPANANRVGVWTWAADGADDSRAEPDALYLAARSDSGTVISITNVGGEETMCNFPGGDVCTASAPGNSAPPVISDATPTAGDTVTATQGTWSGDPTEFTYQWQVDSDSSWQNATGTGSATAIYIVPSGDIGSTLRVCVSASNGLSSEPVCSDATSAVASPYEPLSLSYTDAQFTTGADQEVLNPTVTGGVGTKSYSISGALPPGVTFDTTTGSFTGLASNGWSEGGSGVAAGLYHTCAATTAGSVYCWGSNGSGRLGTGDAVSSTVPVRVTSLGGTALQIGAGDYHTCALLAGGTVKCWGANASGQLGDGTTTARSVPTTVSGLPNDVIAISVGFQYTCALTSGGAPLCWGDNMMGTLGDGTKTNRTTPTAVSGLSSGVSEVVAGQTHTCALLTTGGVKCWGYGPQGQLGNGLSTDSLTPVNVSGMSTASALSVGGYHTCALTTGGAVKCWGAGSLGRIGDGTTNNRSTPTSVTGLNSGVTSIDSGNAHTCALMSNNTALCWGGNGSGQLGDGTTTSSSVPVMVQGLSGATQISAGGGGGGNSHTCARLASAELRCWGDNIFGTIGDGTNTRRLTPVAAGSFSGTQPGFPSATITVTVTDSSGSTSADVILTQS